MPRLVKWDNQKAKQEVTRKFSYAKQSRKEQEGFWESTESIAFNTSRYSSSMSGLPGHDVLNFGLGEVDSGSGDVNVSYAFKNLRLIHAQLSANPPSVVPRPATNDQEDRRKADAADRLVRHAIRTYKMQEKVDKVSLNTLAYGTGFMKTTWDPDKGEIIDFDEETGEMDMTGDLCFETPSPWDVWLDPDADDWEDVRYIIERKYIPFEEALFRWPEYKEQLEKARLVAGQNPGANVDSRSNSNLQGPKYDVVEIFEYWEKGLAPNGFLGRFCYHLKDGTILGDVRPNPFRFKPVGDPEAKFRAACLPFHIFTDIDVPGQVWGKSFMEYVAPLQDLINRLDTTTLDNVQAHGVVRLVLPESAEIADDSITNSPFDVIKIAGSQPPHSINVPTTVPLVDKFRDQMKLGVDDMAGVNEAMFGQQSRETSGFSMQYATNQGNMIRRRLFNKYAMFVESIYKSYLNLVRENWEDERTIMVLGKEKAFETIDLKGADIDGGFDLIVEYGASLSLDPTTRREEIMALQPMFEKAGVPVRVALKMMKLNELEGLHDMVQLADDRQREYFEEMIATGRYIPPGKYEDHPNMLAYALIYRMSTEFKYLEEEQQALVIQHIEDRKSMAAEELMGDTATGQPPGPAPEGPAGPLPQEAAPTAVPGSPVIEPGGIPDIE